jgi:hypothetical protein
VAVTNLGQKSAPAQMKPQSTPTIPTATPQPTVVPTPTPNPTNNWSVYIDDTNRFSLNYPQPWVQNTAGLADPASGQTQVAITVVSTNPGTAVTNFTTQNTPLNEIPKATTTEQTESNIVISQTTLTLFQKSQNGNLVQTNELYAVFIPLNINTTVEIYSDISKQQIINQMAQTFTLFPTVNQSDIATWQSYMTVNGFYHFEYPSDYTLEQQYKVVNGQTSQTQTPNFVELLSPTIIQHEFQITIFYQGDFNNYTLPQAIDNLKDCPSIASANGKQIAFSGVAAYFFPDMPCGVNPITYIYTMYNNQFYTITVSSDVPYEQIQQSVAPILNTFLFGN